MPAACCPQGGGGGGAAAASSVAEVKQAAGGGNSVGTGLVIVAMHKCDKLWQIVTIGCLNAVPYTKTTVAYLTLPSLTSLCGRWAWTPAWSRLELRCGAVCTGNDGLQQVWWMHDFYGMQIDGFLPLLKSLKSLYFPKVKGPAVWFPKLSFLALASAGHRVRDGETGHWCRWWAFPGQRSDGQWNGSFAWLEWILEQRTSTMTVVSYR